MPLVNYVLIAIEIRSELPLREPWRLTMIEWQLLHFFIGRFFLYLGARMREERLEIREIIFAIDALGKTIAPE